MSTVTQVKIFYAWQSDTDIFCNQRAIKYALDQMVPKLEEKYVGYEIIIDQATRALTGSPNISAAIFSKIATADMFVCDITTITEGNATKPSPNPNVLIELGYAVAHLGWDRIVLLFNKAFGNFPNDIPFDIKGHRISDFTISNKADTNGRGQLRELLIKAVGDIIAANPKRPEQSVNNDSKKRKHDVNTIHHLLSNVHMPTYERFLDEAPKQIDTKIFHFWEGYHGLVTGNSFYLYDEELLKLVKEIHEYWGKSLSYDQHYRDSSMDGFVIFGQTQAGWPIPKTKQERVEKYEYYDKMKQQEAKDLEVLENVMNSLRKSSKALMQYLRKEYLEIDIQETNAAAWSDYRYYVDNN